MSERPDFVDQLSSQLQQSVVRVAEQRLKRRKRLAAGALVVGVIVVGAGTWRMVARTPTEQIDATVTEPDVGSESTPPPAGEEEPERANESEFAYPPGAVAE